MASRLGTQMLMTCHRWKGRGCAVRAHMLGVTPRELLCNELHIPGELRLLAPDELVQELLLRQDILHHLLHTSRRIT